LGRELLKSADRLIVLNANYILTDSESQRVFLERETVVKSGQAVVLGAGSISCVDLDRFRPNEEVRQRIRVEWGGAPNAYFLLFVGRLNHDKGVLDLARAFAELSRDFDDIWLAGVGPDEARINNEFERYCGIALSRMRRISYTATLANAMIAADVFALPSYREGFGSVVIEAAACGIPSIGTNIYGLSDAIIDGKTGILIPRSDICALEVAMARLALNGDERRVMGEKARMRVVDEFQQCIIVNALLAFYKHTLDSKHQQALS
jgi:glycosyltransferase involved in cell wall biosynthesis